MNFEKLISLSLCLCLICSLTVTAFAAPTWEYVDEYSRYFPELVPEDYGGICLEYMNAHDAWVFGLQQYAEEREKEKAWTVSEETSSESVFPDTEENSSKAVTSDTEEIPSETTPSKQIESAGSNNDVLSNDVDTSLDTGSADKYPVGSWVDSAGNVFSPSGELLSPGTTPATAPVSDSAETNQDTPDVVGNMGISSVSSDADPFSLTDELAPPVWYVEDLRPTDITEDIMTGLKSMVTSIFGEYTPVTTTSVVSETVGNETHQYLVETVASGAAGVDYEWLAGVILFAIMLFCLMKLLGGVIK